MSEVATFPAGNSQAMQNKGDLDAHFEDQIEAAEAIQEEVYKTRNWLERMFMTPDELLSYLDETRQRIEQAGNPPVVENANVIPLQAVRKEELHASGNRAQTA